MAETKPTEMDQRDLPSESSLVEIASETPQQRMQGTSEPVDRTLPASSQRIRKAAMPAVLPFKRIVKEAMPAVLPFKRLVPKAMPDDLLECVRQPFKACFPPAQKEHIVQEAMPVHRPFEPISQKAMPADLFERVTRPFKACFLPAQEEMEDIVIDISDGDERRGICISRVIHTMRNIKPDVYTPKFVSIGPLHHGNERLQDMERSKQAFFERFTQRPGIRLDVLNGFIESSVPEVRASYSENINLSDGDLLELILVDGAFIIELFFFNLHDDQGKGKEIFADDSTLSKLAILGTLPLDLVLFENQLPFFVLKKLFDIAFPNNVPTFPRLACEFFSKAFDLEMPEHDHDSYASIKHFTDLIRFLLLQRALPTRVAPYLWNTPKLLYSAKELQEFGVNFKVSKSKCILDIKFSGHVLELPQILVADLVTDALFHNTIAFEQLHCIFTSYITNFVTLWSLLINTKEDVHVLVDKKVIRSFMPDTEIVTLFRSMGRSGFQAAMIPEYIDIFQKLNKFCESHCRQNIASLRRDYCRTPWQCVASIAGIFLLALTLVQTIFSILQVVKIK